MRNYSIAAATTVKALRTLFFLAILMLTLSACAREKISVFSEYITIDSLASHHIGTPDPNRNRPPTGQRLFISWDLPNTYNCYQDLHIDLYVRFRNREDDSLTFNLNRLAGTYVYTLVNDDFFKKDGILTYKILLIGGGETLEEWHHQLWVDMIEFPEETPSLYNEDDPDDMEIDNPDQKIDFI